jgi:hypothetical protein
MDLTTIVGGVAVAVIAYFVFFNKKAEETTPTETPKSTDAPVDVPSGDSTK